MDKSVAVHEVCRTVNKFTMVTISWVDGGVKRMRAKRSNYVDARTGKTNTQISNSVSC